MKKEWAKLFSKSKKNVQVEDKLFWCTICNDDNVRFTNAGNYASHMHARHQFHKGFDPELPKPTARKEFSLPNIEKKKPAAPKLKFKNQDDALKYARGKSQKRHKIKKQDYPSMIQSYYKAKKEGRIKEWGIENGIKNPTQRVASWKKSMKKRAIKEVQIE